MIADFRTLIETRRDGKRHSKEELYELAKLAAAKGVPDYQLSAWLMAAFLRPLDMDETTWLTQAIADSGSRLDLSGVPKPWVDKHSTGGVGDKTSIVLLPLLAACGVSVVKMSGAGLGITGGTTDKLSSIPGFRLALSPEELVAQARRIGVAITGQTPDLAPADKVLYGLRDATATVQSVPLIVSSILGKKLAGGAETIVLDVKCGSGAFMKGLPQAQELAQVLAEVGRRCGLKISISITDMSAPLGAAVGNALEVREALTVLSEPPDRLSEPSLRFRELCVDLARETLEACGLPAGRAEEALESGKARDRAVEWISAQGGPSTLQAIFASLAPAPICLELRSEKDGWIESIDAEEVGKTVVDLGGGRHEKGQPIDTSVGVVFSVCVGSRIEKGRQILEVHAKGGPDAQGALARLRCASAISTTSVKPGRLILSNIG